MYLCSALAMALSGRLLARFAWAERIECHARLTPSIVTDWVEGDFTSRLGVIKAADEERSGGSMIHPLVRNSGAPA